MRIADIFKQTIIFAEIKTCINKMDCYTEEIIEYDNPTFHSIEKTYLLTMHDSTRRQQYMTQLNKYKPTKKVIILHNKGYKECSKPEWVKDSAMDLWHANLTALENHFKHEKSPVIILEDDVVFLDQFFELANVIEQFIKSGKVDMYSLGSIPYLSIPINIYHTRMFIGATSHAWIYTSQGYDKMKNVKSKFGLHDLDVSHSLKSYIGTKPCAIQSFSNTNNSKKWNIGNIPIQYMNIFGGRLYQYHHSMGIFGGILPFYIIIIVLIIILFSKKNALEHQTKYFSNAAQTNSQN